MCGSNKLFIYYSFLIFNASGVSKTIVLHGQTEDYWFNSDKKAKFRKVSKFSRVYKGWSSEGQPVVVKILPDELARDEEEVNHFKQEINWYGVHPNLLAPFEYICQNNRHYLISDYVKAIDLSFYFKRKRLFKYTRVKMAIECGLQLLDAVSAIHQKEMIHADIKPGNVLFLTRKGTRPDYKHPQFQLIDFGMARPAGVEPPHPQGRSKRPFVLVYSPPEQVLGFNELTGFHSDLYNIALLLYEMITKEPAYQSRISVKLMNLQTSFPLPRAKVIPSALMDILQKGAAKYHFKKPPNHYSRNEVHHRLKLGIEQRYSSAIEFRNDLLAFKKQYFK